jgi:hypothetical protein
LRRLRVTALPSKNTARNQNGSAPHPTA